MARHCLISIKASFLLFSFLVLIFRGLSQIPSNVIVDNTICQGSSRTLTAPSGYTSYLWSTGAQTQSIQVSPQTTTVYSVTVTNSQLIKYQIDYNVPVIPKPALNISGFTQICNGTSSHLSAVTENGGANIASYAWSNGALSPDIIVNPTSNTTYSVTITDFYGCKNNASLSVTVNPAVSLTSTITDAACSGALTGSIALNPATGLAPFSYDWTDLNLSSEPKDRSGIKAGNYSVIVTDANNCATVGYYQVKDPLPLWSTEDIFSPTCSVSGSINIYPTGGTLPYQFDWLDVSGTNNPQNRTGLGPGIYTVIIKDARGCNLSKDIILAAPTAPTGYFSTSGVTCNNQSSGSINLTITGGTAPYQFFWNDMGGVAGPEDRSGLVIGTYPVTVKDANGCTVSFSPSVTIDPTSYPYIYAYITNVNCYGETSGSITISNNGASYIYDWADISGSNDIQNRTGLAPGTYNLSVKNSIGCFTNYNFTITSPTPLNVNGTVSGTSCGLNNGNINLSVQGGTLPYTFDWADLNGTTDPQDRSGLMPGTYTVIVKDGNGCAQTKVYNIAASLIPFIANDTVTHVSCYSGATGAIKLQVFGNSPPGVSKPFIYDWDDIIGNDNIRDRILLKAGTYKLTVTDYYGCIVRKQYEVTQPSTPMSVSADLIAAQCGQSNGSVTLTVSGGQSPYLYDWLDLSGTSNPKDRTALLGATYEVIIKDQLGCQVSNAYKVNAPAAPIVTAVINQITCAGLSNGVIDVSVAGGKAPYIYDWIDIAGTSNSQDRTGLTAGSYDLKVTDSTGCSVSTTFKINAPVPLGISARIAHVMLSNLSGELDITVTGGTPPYKYDWSDISGANDSEDRTGLTAGAYTIIVTDANGCTISSMYTVNSSLSPLSIIDSTSTVKCFGRNDGSIRLIVSGGLPPYSFDWNDISSTSDPRDRSGLGAGTYSVVVTDALGQRLKSDINVSQPSAVTINPEIVDSTTASKGFVHLAISGGVTPYVFDWDDIPGVNNTENRDSLSPGIYKLKVIDFNGCTLDTTMYINQSLISFMEIGAYISPVRCAGGSDGAIDISITGGVYPYTYDWYDVAGTSNSISRSGLGKGFYTLEVTDARSQKVHQTFEIKEPSVLSLTYTTTTASNRNGTITTASYGGTPPYYYDWLDLTGSFDPQNRTWLMGGNYIITLRDSLGCTL